jgi:hypothetical protein
VRKYRGAAVFCTPVLAAQLSGQKRIPPAGIHNEPCFPGSSLASSILRVDHRRLPRAEFDALRSHSFVKVDTLCHGIAGQDGIELGSFDLEGIGLGFVEGFGEIKHL